MEKSMSLKEFLRERRELAGRTLEGMSAVLKMPVERLIDFELGNQPVPLDELWAICNCLRLNPNDLIELFECLPSGETHE